MPACLNAANEELVAGFLAEQASGSSISRVISKPSCNAITTGPRARSRTRREPTAGRARRLAS